jgi:FkbM family methyltransferase
MNMGRDHGRDMSFPLIARLALPYARLELPGWGKVLRAAGVYRHDCWDGAPTRVIRGKFHGYRMTLSLQSWSERQTYFLGRYYELDTQAFAITCLRPGDTFIDVGGNIGMMTLLGSRLVSPGGRVHTFEPNPREGERIRRTLDENGIDNVTLHRMGLSDAPAELTLSVITEHSGMATFAPVEGDDAKLVSATHVAKVVRGDDVLPHDLAGAVTMKIDIEGFECRAIRGLMGTIRRYRPAIVTEVIGHHLQRAGHSVGELFDLMNGLNYRAYHVGIRRKRGRQKLSLRSIDKAVETMDSNVAWVCPGTVHENRLGPFVDA